MCLFPFKNTSYKSEAYKKGIREFECGCCPECLSKRARLWSLRCSAEAQYTVGCMITLTYDNYARDERGNIIGELPVNSSIPLSKRDCQLFIKRLRKHFNDTKIKYLITAERGKRTNRAHYHAILFGVDFTDKVKYKRSDRGNIIYKSATLTKLWNHGICTIDAVNINSQVARYCTKYCAKDTRADDTFMLMSRGIGDKWLMEKFNGLSYMIDGREYSIPKLIWNKYIENKYSNNYVFNRWGATYKYRNVKWYDTKYDELTAQYLADLNSKQRQYFRNFRDFNSLYQKYLSYWQNKAIQYESTRPNVFTRILQLDDNKYHRYKQACLKTLVNRHVDLYKRDVENVYLPPRYISQYRKIKALELGSHLPATLVIKGQMTPKLKRNLDRKLYKPNISDIRGRFWHRAWYNDYLRSINSSFVFDFSCLFPLNSDNHNKNLEYIALKNTVIDNYKESCNIKNLKKRIYQYIRFVSIVKNLAKNELLRNLTYSLKNFVKNS